jgi:hypothetical protein
MTHSPSHERGLHATDDGCLSEYARCACASSASPSVSPRCWQQVVLTTWQVAGARGSGLVERDEVVVVAEPGGAGAPGEDAGGLIRAVCSDSRSGAS